MSIQAGIGWNHLGAACSLFNSFWIFFFLWLHWVSTALHGLSLVVASGGYSSLLGSGLSLWWFLLLQSIGSRCKGFSSCGAQV